MDKQYWRSRSGEDKNCKRQKWTSSTEAVEYRGCKELQILRRINVCKDKGN